MMDTNTVQYQEYGNYCKYHMDTTMQYQEYGHHYAAT